MTSGYRVIGYRVIALALAGVTASSCRLGKPTEPALTGPSMFGVTVMLAATPDILPRDGRTTSRVVATVRDGANRPVAGQGLHFEVRIEGRPGQLGVLSQSDVATSTDGSATVLYTPPLPAPMTDQEAATIQIVVTPVGSNSSNQTASSATIKLAELGGPTATFKLAPDPMVAGETAIFDASASAPSAGHSITTYAWDFGDGDSAFVIAPGPRISHEYFREGVFTVRLRVIDTSGRNQTITRNVTVIGAH